MDSRMNTDLTVDFEKWLKDWQEAIDQSVMINPTMPLFPGYPYPGLDALNNDLDYDVVDRSFFDMHLNNNDHYCDDNIKEYVGITQRYSYCTVCDKKFVDNT